jgi:hypothetical protein
VERVGEERQRAHDDLARLAEEVRQLRQQVATSDRHPSLE